MNIRANVNLITERLVCLGWTQAELAEASNLSKRTVEGILSRGTASLESLHRIATALEVDVNTIRHPVVVSPQPLIQEPPKDIPGVVAEVVRTLLRRETVNLVVYYPDWRPVVDEIVRRLTDATTELVGRIDLDHPLTATRKGLLGELLAILKLKTDLPDAKPHDLEEFGRRLQGGAFAYVVLTHFDHVAVPERKAEYGIDLFHALRWATSDKPKSLTTLLVSRKPMGELLPTDHPLSGLNAVTVELGARR